MKITTRQEIPKDYSAITNINNLAFNQPQEGLLIEKLRKREEFIPELSLLAFVDEEPVGHILFFPVNIQTDAGPIPSLSLAPMAVLPDFQKKGVGKKLIEAGKSKANELNYGAIIVLGHPEYYPRFGFEMARKWNIRSPWNVPDEAWMAIELKDGALKNCEGMVVFPPEYYEAV